jgi:(1->4)-alpha-D-glucan 1-alpha-D-glucosylmutase
MAKSWRIPLFIAFTGCSALNEVGGNPAAGGLSVANFHGRMQERAAHWPHGLTATATHDTKRGEDARARLLSAFRARRRVDRKRASMAGA